MGARSVVGARALPPERLRELPHGGGRRAGPPGLWQRKVRSVEGAEAQVRPGQLLPAEPEHLARLAPPVLRTETLASDDSHPTEIRPRLASIGMRPLPATNGHQQRSSAQIRRHPHTSTGIRVRAVHDPGGWIPHSRARNAESRRRTPPRIAPRRSPVRVRRAPAPAERPSRLPRFGAGRKVREAPQPPVARGPEVVALPPPNRAAAAARVVRDRVLNDAIDVD